MIPNTIGRKHAPVPVPVGLASNSRHSKLEQNASAKCTLNSFVACPLKQVWIGVGGSSSSVIQIQSLVPS